MRRLALAALLLAAPVPRAAGQAGPDDGLFGRADRFAERGGEAVYRHVCAGCHMPDGRGAAGAGSYPSLVENAKLELAAYPIAVVLNGQGAMPALGRFLTDAQVAGVVGYVRTHFGNGYGEVTPEEVEQAR